MLRDQLDRAGIKVGRRHVCTVMKRMGIEALYRKPGTSKKRPGHTIYPYLLRGMTINRTNQVWTLDTTYIRMAKGFVYLTAVVDWASRKVLAAKVAITLEASHAVDVLKEAFNRHGALRSSTPDQRSQFTAEEFVQAQSLRMQIEHGWSWILARQCLCGTSPVPVKYEDVYLHAYDSVNEARRSIMRYLDWYNRFRPHSRIKENA